MCMVYFWWFYTRKRVGHADCFLIPFSSSKSVWSRMDIFKKLQLIRQKPSLFCLWFRFLQSSLFGINLFVRGPSHWGCSLMPSAWSACYKVLKMSMVRYGSQHGEQKMCVDHCMISHMDIDELWGMKMLLGWLKCFWRTTWALKCSNNGAKNIVNERVISRLL